MKQLLLSIALVYSAFAYGQCTPDFSQTAVGIYPDTLPTGYVGVPYSEDITFVLPTDTLGYDFLNFEIVSVVLPVGLNWQCNNFANGCNYDPQVNQYGCVNVSGTPLLPGFYPVDVTVIADLTVITGYPVTFQVFMEVLPNNVPVSNNGFTMVGSSGCMPITVDFTNNNPGLQAYTWNFGNGNTSTAENPVPQVYTTPGDYVVNYAAYDDTTITEIYTLTGLTITGMSNYGGGFPSFENADAYFILYENGSSIYQSNTIQDTDPPVSWTTNLVLTPGNTYTVHVWEADNTVGEVAFGADDDCGTHILNMGGCNGCVTNSGNATLNYSIVYQQILPNPSVLSADTIHVYGLPALPVISYNTSTNQMSIPNTGDIYQWYFNGSPMSGETDTIIDVTVSGVYSVAAINSNGCVSISDTLTGIYCDPNLAPDIFVSALNELTATGVPVGYDIQWYQNGQPIPGATNTVYAMTSNGYFEVEMVDTFGCTHTSAPYAMFLNLEEVVTVDWEAFPNPADDVLHVRMGTVGSEYQLSLVDLSGRIVAESDVRYDNAYTFQVGDLPSGYYLLKLKIANRELVKKIVLK